MRIKVVEPLSTTTAAAAAQDVDKLLELRAKLRAVDVYIQAPNVEAQGFIQLINVILELLPDAPDLGWPARRGWSMRASDHVLWHLTWAWCCSTLRRRSSQRDRADLRQVQVDLQSIEELVYGKLNEPPSAFGKLIDVLLPLLPDAEEEIEAVEKIEEQEEPAESIEVIEEQDPDPTPLPQKRSLVDRLWNN